MVNNESNPGFSGDKGAVPAKDITISRRDFGRILALTTGGGVLAGTGWCVVLDHFFSPKPENKAQAIPNSTGSNLPTPESSLTTSATTKTKTDITTSKAMTKSATTGPATSTKAPITDAVTAPKNENSNPLKGLSLCSNPNSTLTSHEGEFSPEMYKKLYQPTALWHGDWNTVDTIQSIVRSESDTITSNGTNNHLPVFVVYNIKNRDQPGGFSTGGASTDTEYLKWVTEFAKGNNRKSLVIMEPDALAFAASFKVETDKTARINAIKEAIRIIRQTNNNCMVAIDAAHLGWPYSDNMISMLKEVGLGMADGPQMITLNVSNYRSTNECEEYAKVLLASFPPSVGYIIDTSRNGAVVTDDSTCNPNEARLGKPPYIVTDQNADPREFAHLWIKPPWESDGACGHKYPKAGEFSKDYSLILAS